jgi:hypothetical protein
MEQLSHDYSYQTETRRDGVLESASKRVRMIFSVMASPNRIDILRILNSKGPLTYSEKGVWKICISFTKTAKTITCCS